MSKTVIVVIVLVVLLVAFMMYQNAQSQKSANEMMLWQMQNPNQQTANMWSSMGNWADIIGATGGLFGGGSNDSNVVVNGEEFDEDYWSEERLVNTRQYRNSPMPTSYNATIGFDNLQDMVDTGEGMLLN